jgi:hypothetical protein
LHEQVRALDADADNASQEPYHRCASFSMCLFEALGARCLDFFDLLLYEGQVGHVAPQLGERIRRHGRTIWCAQSFQLLRGLSEGRPESSNPRRPGAALTRFTMRVHSLTRLSRSRLGRLASSSSIVGIAAMLQRFGSPRNQPRKARLSISESTRSVFARLCSRETGTLAGG